MNIVMMYMSASHLHELQRDLLSEKPYSRKVAKKKTGNETMKQNFVTKKN